MLLLIPNSRRWIKTGWTFCLLMSGIECKNHCLALTYVEQTGWHSFSISWFSLFQLGTLYQILGVKAILSVKKHLLRCQLHDISKESASCEVSQSVCKNITILLFALLQITYIYHKITKTSEALLSKPPRMNACLCYFIMVLRQWAGRVAKTDWTGCLDRWGGQGIL